MERPLHYYFVQVLHGTTVAYYIHISRRGLGSYGKLIPHHAHGYQIRAITREEYEQYEHKDKTELAKKYGELK